MKILYVSQYFPPEMGAPAARVHELSREWVRMGHEVTVLTGFPNHPEGRVRDAYRSRLWRLTLREQVDGISVVRTILYPAPNRGALGRMLNYLSFFMSAVVRGAALRAPDVVIGTSPQLLSAAAGWLLAARFRCPFVFEVRDLWPESLPAVGASSEGSLLYRVLQAVAMVLYRRASLVVPVTDGFVPTVKAYAPSAPIAVVENGVDLDRFKPQADRQALRIKWGLDGHFVASYIGTIGMAHGLATLLEAAAILQRTLPDALLLVVGEGAEREPLERRAAAAALTNVRFVGQRPRQDIPELVGASDVCLVMLRDSDVFKTVLPSKLPEFMACGTPTIVTVDGFARQLVAEGDAGVYAAAGDARALASAIVDLAREPARRAQLGANGRAFAVRRFDRSRKAAEYLRSLRAIHSPAAAAARLRPAAPLSGDHAATSTRSGH
jgi:colanic acid biosynthesis glycosyl transferase WcaI